MQHWIAEHRLHLILVMVLDGAVMTCLAGKHRKPIDLHDPGVGYFWSLMKQGDTDGIVATVATTLAAGAGFLPDLRGKPGRSGPGWIARTAKPSHRT